MFTGFLNNDGKILLAVNRPCDPQSFRLGDEADGKINLRLVCGNRDVMIGVVDQKSQLGRALKACSTLDVMFPNDIVIENLRRAA